MLLNNIFFIIKIPTAKVWFNAANKLFNYLVMQSDDNEEASDLLNLKNYLDIDQRFSEARCNKVFPLAIATYQENLPTHYTKKYHETKVNIYLILFIVLLKFSIFIYMYFIGNFLYFFRLLTHFLFSVYMREGHK